MTDSTECLAEGALQMGIVLQTEQTEMFEMMASMLEMTVIVAAFAVLFMLIIGTLAWVAGFIVTAINSARLLGKSVLSPGDHLRRDWIAVALHDNSLFWMMTALGLSMLLIMNMVVLAMVVMSVKYAERAGRDPKFAEVAVSYDPTFIQLMAVVLVPFAFGAILYGAGAWLMDEPLDEGLWQETEGYDGI